MLHAGLTLCSSGRYQQGLCIYGKAWDVVIVVVVVVMVMVVTGGKMQVP